MVGRNHETKRKAIKIAIFYCEIVAANSITIVVP